MPRVNRLGQGDAPVASFALAALGLVVASVAVAAATADVAPPTTYGATSNALLVIDVVAGTAALAAGVAATTFRSRRLTGMLTVSIGAAWFANDVIGWEAGPATVRTLAALAASFTVVLVLHLVVTFTPGRARTSSTRRLVAAAYAVTAAVVVAGATLRDPFLDRGCWANCTDNVLLLRAEPELAGGLERAAAAVAVAIALAVVGIVGRRLSTATSVERRATWFVLAPAAVLAVAAAGHVVLVALMPPEDPVGRPFVASFVVRAAAVISVAAGTAWELWRRSRATRAIRDLAVDLAAAPPGELQTMLARSLDDADLTVAYWLPSTRRFVDRDGRPTEPQAGPGRSATPIMNGRTLIAVIVHDASLELSEELARRFGSAASVAIDNERLRAGIMAQVEELRASRKRIVETEDETRRQLERNLHDGAQQRLFAVAFELRLATSAAVAEGLPGLAATISEFSGDVGKATTDLRDIAHGIHPVILSEAGLHAAVRRLVERATIPVELSDCPLHRYPTAVESAAYYVSSVSIDEAVRAGAGRASLGLGDTGTDLVLTVTHDGAEQYGAVDDERADGVIVHLTDRVGALGGSIDVDAGAGGTRIEARIPCVS